VQEGRGADALDVLRSGSPEVELVEVDDAAYLSADQLAGVRAEVQECGAALHAAAERGDTVAALDVLERHRLLCAHRRGLRGVQHWSALAARWIAEVHTVVPRADGRYAGEPLLVTTNDRDIDLYNGDTGVVVNDGHGGLIAAFAQIAFDPTSTVPSLGASGAIAGVLGAYFVTYPTAPVDTLIFVIFIFFVRLPAFVVLGVWIVLQFFTGVGALGTHDTGGVATFAHIGGFVAGMVLVFLFRKRSPPTPLPSPT